MTLPATNTRLVFLRTQAGMIGDLQNETKQVKGNGLVR